MGITECIFSISQNVFTPFYLGLAVQLYHNFGSKQLIKTLYSHGFCASYGEVRQYLTSIVHHEMEKLHDDVHVPDGIIPIREGANNIDINTETIDGKNTFHSMARAVFQIRHYTVEPNSNQTKIKRSQERSVQMDESASSLTACVPFNKPNTRGIPGRCENAFDKISDCTGNLSNLSELFWLHRKSVSRTILEIPVHFPMASENTFLDRL
jgi:hypothetical protein